MLVEERFVKGKGRHYVDFVEDDGVGHLEHAGVLEWLVIAFGHRQDHHLDVLAQVEVRRAYEVPHVFDEDEVDVVQVEHVKGATQHVALEMTGTGSVDLYRGNTQGLDGLRIDVARDVALDDGDVVLVAQRVDGRHDGRGLARPGARQHVDHVDALLVEQGAVCRGAFVVLVQDLGFQVDVSHVILLSRCARIWPMHIVCRALRGAVLVIGCFDFHGGDIELTSRNQDGRCRIACGAMTVKTVMFELVTAVQAT